MGLIGLRELTLGQPNSTEDADIISNFTTLLNLVNGNIDTNNLSSSAGIVAGQLASNAVETAKIKDANVTYAKLAADVRSQFLTILLGTEARMTGLITSPGTGIQQPGAANRKNLAVTHNLGLRTASNVVLLGSVYDNNLNNPASASWALTSDGFATNSCQIQIENVGDAASNCSWRGFAIGWGGFS